MSYPLCGHPHTQKLGFVTYKVYNTDRQKMVFLYFFYVIKIDTNVMIIHVKNYIISPVIQINVAVKEHIWHEFLYQQLYICVL